jgi:aspartate aminotransferase-like enzyme
VESPDPDEVGQPCAGTGIVFCQQSDTSTGVVADVRGIREAVAGATLVVDAISSLGAVPLETDAWGIDVVISGSQKALMSPPGLAMASVPEHVLAEASEPRTFYFDWRANKKAQDKLDAAITPAVSIIRSLDVALGLLLGDGLEAAFAHVRLGRAARAGIKAWVSGSTRPMTTAPPWSRPYARRGDRRRAAPPSARPARRHAPRTGSPEGKIFASVIGWFDVFDIASALAAVELSLTELGAEIDRGVAVARAFGRSAHHRVTGAGSTKPAR